MQLVGAPRQGDYFERICTPEETLARVMPLLPSFGVTRLSRLTGLDRIGIPVWNAVSPNSRSIAISQGKGINDISAKASAAMEALERAVAGNPDVKIKTATLAQLHCNGAHTNPMNSLVAAGQSELRDDDYIEWIRGYDLLAAEYVWVPLAAVALDRTVADNRYWQSSDGLASGNLLIEAVFHGVLERVERDAEVLWQLNEQSERDRQCIDAHSFGDPVLNDLIARIAAAGMRLQLFDMTSDIGVPCFTALIVARNAEKRTSLRLIDVANGSGCHPVVAHAAIRAVTEAAQSRLTYISGARDDIAPETFSRTLPRHVSEDLEAIPRPMQGYPHALEGPGLAEFVEQILRKLRTANVTSAIVVPLTRENAPFAVARLLVPQLENPDGKRKQRFGSRAITRMLQLI